MLSLTFLFLYSPFSHSPLSASVLFVLFFTANRLATLLQLLYDSSSYILFNTAILRARTFDTQRLRKNHSRRLIKFHFLHRCRLLQDKSCHAHCKMDTESLNKVRHRWHSVYNAFSVLALRVATTTKKHLFSQS